MASSVLSFIIAVNMSLYFCCLCCFSLVLHPISYCLLLLLCSFSTSVISYISFGFSWYVLIFILVYVGGIYVLFIYVSLLDPNSITWCGTNFKSMVFLWFFFSFSFLILMI